MRISIALLGCLFLGACGGDGGFRLSSDTSDTRPDPAERARNRPLVIAHRGASGHAPEHTFAAYDLARDMGADYVEQDIQITLDGVLVCRHDDTLDRTARGDPANCTGLVALKTLAQLETCDMGSWFNDAFPERARAEYVGQKIPTMEEVFRRYGKAVNYYVETKTLGQIQLMEQPLHDLIVKYDLLEGARERRQVFVQSFFPDSLLRMLLIDPAIPRIQLLQAGEVWQLTLPVAAAYAFGVGPGFEDVSADYLATAHGLGLAVHPYTVDEAEDMRRLTELCADGMFTNFPDRLVSVRSGAAACPEP